MDWEKYEADLAMRLGNDNLIARIVETKVRQDVKRVVIVNAENAGMGQNWRIFSSKKKAMLAESSHTLKYFCENLHFNLPEIIS